MTYYQNQISLTRDRFIPKDYLCDQVIAGKKFMDKNFTKKISLNDIAKNACISKFHFLRLFKILYGRTPHQYITAKRIEKAKQLLSNGSTVSEVCFTVGFESISSFKGLFKFYTGHTPAYYRP